MSWFKVDDKLNGSPKRLMASTEAMGLWVCAGSWSREKKTGGYVPREALRVIAPDKTFDEAEALAAELVAAMMPGLHEHGFWVPVANGWQFHDWEVMQPDDELEAQRRESISKVRSEAGLRGAQARWQSDGKNGFANANGGNAGSRARPHVGSPSPSPSPSGSDPVSLEPGSNLRLELSDLSEPKDLTGSARETGESVPADAAPAAKSPFNDDAEREVFEYWTAKLWRRVHEHGRDPRATRPRLNRIRARLRSGYGPAQLKLVVDRVAASKFHLGGNDQGKPYIEPKTIFRNDETVDEWLAKKPSGVIQARPGATPTQPNYGVKAKYEEM